ncbi:translational activator of cytochrome c oxidase 1 [Petromyzon marinus]|uniref:Translational activator of cytochrome c oxidase 1 n=2 Tax=Petromyzon marinus TaxID=7757 RepID=A0AAJ7SM92_PETMA|nr:translational activator of cytochrome c oxidase 1 [Petromyzon marinus]XP_032801893.1 translational activator of cytochrome c oxidase 1 [Petromyzon marinus]XP_032801894.1 translational activator of cytochrome c oxidase 1 [Petromyzon marinus]XP_032801895.1 translational activator of cytochrome c oxidase 1 [Petromyzon marinus]XP_032801896.1 translational activator of cytochrome c oxidase 1 [Petromyzon marinus]
MAWAATLKHLPRRFWAPLRASLQSVLLDCPVESGFSYSRCQTVRGYRVSARALAGHNKWSKVKNIKGPKDTARSLEFSKLGIMIRHAVKEGGPNPDMNSALASLLEVCRSKNMPKATYETAIKGADKSKPLTIINFGVRGPGGFALLVETCTDNYKRTNSDIRNLVNKNGGSLFEGAKNSFEQRGVVTIRKDSDRKNLGLEEALELAIEVGAEDVREQISEDDPVNLQFVCAVQSLREVRERLMSLGFTPLSSALEFIPVRTVELKSEEMDVAAHLVHLMESLPDVVRVYDNVIAIDS